MPLQETLDTFKYFLSEADKLQLSYIVLVRYVATLDVEIDGKSINDCREEIMIMLMTRTPIFAGKMRAIVHDVLESYRPVIKNAKLFLNGGVSPIEGAELVESGKIDGISIGFLWITHPDLAKRVQHGKPLDNTPDFPHLQTGKDSSDFSVGYTDYPVAVY